MSQRSAQYRIQPGQMLGRHYRVVDYLGHGWEGEVYKVEEVTTGILRAAKLFYKHRYLKKNLPHVAYAKKLFTLRDCDIVIQYHHQDTITLKKEAVDFLVSDFADGYILSQFVKRQPRKRLLPFEALHLFYALVQGVEQIHFLGEYHGDIHTDNIIVKRKGLTFDVNLIDLLHAGKPSKAKIQQDVYQLIDVLFDMLGGAKHYSSLPRHIKKIILGRKSSLIAKQFKNAGQLRLFLENLDLEMG